MAVHASSGHSRRSALPTRDWLERAHCSLLAQAKAIFDAGQRQMFLVNIPHYREIIALWQSEAVG